MRGLTRIGRAVAHLTRRDWLLACGGGLAGQAWAQTLYKSQGVDGRVVYSDKPPVVGRLEKTMKFDNLPRTPLPAAAAAQLQQLQQAQKVRPPTTPSPPVSSAVLYLAAWCGYCTKARAYLASKGIAYRDVDIDSRDGMAAFAQVGGGTGVPLLVAAGHTVRGFSVAAYDAVFAARR